MYKSSYRWLTVLLLALVINVNTYAVSNFDKGKRPPKPEKIEEVQGERPSSYHTWVKGKWKWDRGDQEWNWREGYWREMSPDEIMRNRYGRLNPYGYYGYGTALGFSPFLYNGLIPRYRIAPRIIVVRRR